MYIVDDFHNDVARMYGMQLTDVMSTQFKTYAQRLQSENAKHNLTAIRAYEEIFRLHFLDSLAAMLVFRTVLDRNHIVDCGTGAGFPGLALKIAAPKYTVTLIESTRKKAQFCTGIIEELMIKDAEVLNTRIESYLSTRKDALHQTFFVFRAVGSLHALHPYIAPIVESNGHVIVYKGRKVHEELQSMTELYSMHSIRYESTPYCLPGDRDSRVLVHLYR